MFPLSNANVVTYIDNYLVKTASLLQIYSKVFHKICYETIGWTHPYKRMDRNRRHPRLFPRRSLATDASTVATSSPSINCTALINKGHPLIRSIAFNSLSRSISLAQSILYTFNEIDTIANHFIFIRKLQIFPTIYVRMTCIVGPNLQKHEFCICVWHIDL